MIFKTPLKYKIIGYLAMPVILVSYTIGAIPELINTLISKIKRR